MLALIVILLVIIACALSPEIMRGLIAIVLWASAAAACGAILLVIAMAVSA